jgi:hypothetical protein
MPFGKYRGWSLERIPGSYLQWVIRTCDAAPPALLDAVADELVRRDAMQCRRAEQSQNADACHAVIDKWYDEMSRWFHPDRGCHTEAMKAINIGVERLREMVEEARGT